MQPAGFEDWKAVALESNPEIAAQRHVMEVAGEEINNRVPAHFPRINLVRAITQDKSGPGRNRRVDWQHWRAGQYSHTRRRRHLRPRHRTASNHEKAKADLDTTINRTLVELKKHSNLTLTSASRIAALVKS